jgi:hypothetical protein
MKMMPEMMKKYAATNGNSRARKAGTAVRGGVEAILAGCANLVIAVGARNCIAVGDASAGLASY